MRASKWKHTELLATEGCVGQVFHLLKATDGEDLCFYSLPWQRMRRLVSAFSNMVAANHMWKLLKEMGIPDHLICLLRNLYAGQEATVRTGHGTSLLFYVQF